MVRYFQEVLVVGAYVYSTGYTLPEDAGGAGRYFSVIELHHEVGASQPLPVNGGGGAGNPGGGGQGRKYWT